MEKIQMKTPLVEMDGDEMTRILWADIKQLLRMAAEKEHRSIASMMEVLILNYAQEHGLEADAQLGKEAKKKKASDGTH